LARLLALPALKVTGPYLAMVTLAFGTIVVTLINEMTDLGPWFNHLNLTNGPLGIELRTPLFIDLRDYIDLSLKRLREVEYYYISAIALVLTVVVINRIIASRYGRAFEALRDSPIASDCMGVSVYKHKVLAFVISAGFAGLAGALYAYFRQYIAPEAFNFATSIEFLLAVAMGGRKSQDGADHRLGHRRVPAQYPGRSRIVPDHRRADRARGAVPGGFSAWRNDPSQARSIGIPVALCVLFFVFSLFLERIVDYKLTIYGLMILFVVYYLPDGIMGFVRQLLTQLSLRRGGRALVARETGDASRVWGATQPRRRPEASCSMRRPY
jgi:ABC-type branched-subunit amino acid transport system permease subunit